MVYIKKGGEKEQKEEEEDKKDSKININSMEKTGGSCDEISDIEQGHEIVEGKRDSKESGPGARGSDSVFSGGDLAIENKSLI